MLLRLYRSILVPLLSEWLCDRQLCALDCAVCNHDVRPILLALFQMSSIIIVDLSMECAYFWAQLRGLKIRQAQVSNHRSVLLNEILSQIPEYDFVDVITDCQNTIELQLKGKRIHHMTLTIDLFVSHMRESLESVRLLDLRFYGICIAISDYQVLVESAPNLEAICMSFWEDLEGLSVFHRVQVTKDTFTLIDSQDNSYFKYTVRSLPQYYDSHEQLPSWAICVDGVAYELIKLSVSSRAGPEPNVNHLMPFIERLQCLTFCYNHSSLIELITAKCSRLLSLTIDHIDFTDTDFASIFVYSAQSLTSVDMWCSDGISMKSLCAALRCCSRLTQLALYDVDVPDFDVQQVCDSCPSLTSFVFQLIKRTVNAPRMAVRLHCVEFTNKSYQTVLTEHNNRRMLTTYCRLQDDDPFFSRNPDLIEVIFHYYQCQSDQTIKLMTQHCPHLTSVDIGTSQGISGNVLQYLSTCDHLTALGIKKVRLSSEAIEHFLISKPYLLKLGLRQCTGFNGGEVLKMVAKHCRHIRKMTITNKSNVSRKDTIRFVGSCPALRVLCLEGCSPVHKQLKDTISLLTFLDNSFKTM